MTELRMRSYVWIWWINLEKSVTDFDAEHKEIEAEYQYKQQSHDAQMADILYLKRTMIEEYETEREKRNKIFQATRTTAT